MGMLRNTIRSQFLEILDNSSFTAEDFDITFGDPEEFQNIVDIRFIHDKSLFLSFSESEGSGFGGFDYRIERSPGDVLEKETQYINSFNNIFSILSVWVDEVRAELEAKLPTYRDIGDLKALIEEAISSSISDDEEFSVEEINSLRRKFDELEKRVSELEHEQVITANQKEDFSKGLETVSENLEKLPKQTWLKTSVNKLSKTVSTIARSKEGRSLLAESARKLLGLE